LTFSLLADFRHFFGAEDRSLMGGGMTPCLMHPPRHALPGGAIEARVIKEAEMERKSHMGPRRKGAGLAVLPFDWLGGGFDQSKGKKLMFTAFSGKFLGAGAQKYLGAMGLALLMGTAVVPNPAEARGYWDRVEDYYDRAEDRADRREDIRDRREDIRDRREDYYDALHFTGPGDLIEDYWDAREDIADRREDIRDRREDRWDAREDRWDRRH